MTRPQRRRRRSSGGIAAGPAAGRLPVPGNRGLANILYMDTPTLARASTGTRKLRVGVGQLASGMYVVELDRPWLDTPFLLEGFLVDSPIELETLRRYCRYVYVDPDRSDPTLARRIRDAELADAPLVASPRRSETTVRLEMPKRSGEARQERRASPAPKARTDARVSSETRERFRRFVRATAVAGESLQAPAGVLGRTAGWLRRWMAADDRDPVAWQQRSLQAVHDLLPLGTRVVRHPDPQPFAEAMPAAREAIARAGLATEALYEAVRNGSDAPVGPLHESVTLLVAAMIANPDAPAWAARVGGAASRDTRHALTVALHLLAVGRSIGLDRETLRALATIGLLADTGKARLPRALLEKPGMLSASEHTIVKEHVRLGLEAVERSGPLAAEVRAGIAQHHERLDGSGYPKGLQGEEISFWGRLAAIADSFAALVSPRPYAEALAPQEAMMSLYEWAGNSFDEALVEQFVQAIGIFPVGSIVELSSGEIAVVIGHNRIRRLEPRVLAVSDAAREPLGAPALRELPSLHRGSPPDALRVARGLPASAFDLGRIDLAAFMPGRDVV